MSSAKVNKFAKSDSCPSTEQLLSFTLADLSMESASEVVSHLEMCDFCGAEAHFLSRHRTSSSPNALAEMPPHLRLLAESLLGKRGFECALFSSKGLNKLVWIV